MPDESLALGTVGEFAEGLLAAGADELDDLRGELRVLVYTEAAPPRAPSRCWYARSNSGAINRWDIGNCRFGYLSEHGSRGGLERRFTGEKWMLWARCNGLRRGGVTGV
ncbi:hypothetical protein ACFQY4_24920 [Catellatospora bangladeshensis]|uniref:hypothetical protein n=1 Tax=Catellatospora bangladeshensis TaxID=310355 RepID=UPI00361125B8